jgi:BMFP domain-containing protein YqiC
MFVPSESAKRRKVAQSPNDTIEDVARALAKQLNNIQGWIREAEFTDLQRRRLFRLDLVTRKVFCEFCRRYLATEG